MINLDNLELDFDDDFAPSIFSKCLSNRTESNGNNNKVLQEAKTTNSKLTSSVQCKKSLETETILNSKLQDENSRNTFMLNSFSVLLNKDSNSSVSNNIPNLKRPSVQDENPQKKRLSHGRLLERKFPGPAGLLPDKPFKDIEDISLLLDKTSEGRNTEEVEKEEPMFLSQSSASVFLESTYQKLVLDFDLNEPGNPLNKYTVDWVKKSAIKKALHGRKIPFLAVVLHNINHSTPDPVLMLRDPTGEINGTLHREVWANLGGKLRTGITLALRQVGVVITGVIRRQIYMNITLNNILAIYSTTENGVVEVKTVNKISKDDLMKSISDRQSANLPPKHQRTPSPSLFPVRQSSPSTSKNPSKEPEMKENDEFLANLGIVLTDGDFNDVMDLPNTSKEKIVQSKKAADCFEEKAVTACSQALSQADSQILEEVLSGVNLDEFEL